MLELNAAQHAAKDFSCLPAALIGIFGKNAPAAKIRNVGRISSLSDCCTLGVSDGESGPICEPLNKPRIRLRI